MKLTFLGAAHEVTGSRHLLEASGKRVLVDYGMEQGANLYENAPLPCPASSIDAVVLTHAHIDHSGWLPLLVQQGFRGPIFATQGTADLSRIMLMDSAHIQEMEAEWKNRKAKRGSREPVEPLYTQKDAEQAIAQFVPCRYRAPFEVCEGITGELIDVGHLLGSASVRLSITESGKTQRIVFSGDVGNVNQPLLRDPETFDSADFVVMESTYGDRSHGERPDYLSEMVSVLRRTFARGGNVVIPSFAVGRTQEMLYLFREIKEKGLVPGHDFPVYVDSPMAIEATQVFSRDVTENCDEETCALLRAGVNPLRFDGLITATTAEESKAINDDPTPKVILSASGMCDAGRIRHHLKHNLWRPECTVLFVGYQSVGTTGRVITEGAESVRLFGEKINVQAEIVQLRGVSGHADNEGLMAWARAIEGVRHAFVVHGDDEVTDLFSRRLREERGWQTTAPYPGESWDLTHDVQLAPGNRERIERVPVEEAQEEIPSKSQLRRDQKQQAQAELGQAAALALRAAYEELGRWVERAMHRGKKEQERLTDRINGLLKKLR